jgi:hypothetical protein
MHTKNVAQPYLQNTVQLIEKFVDEGVMSRDDAQKILGYGKNQKVDYKDFSKKLNSDGYKFIRGEVGSTDLFKIKQKMDNWLSTNKALSGMNSDQYKSYRDSSLKFGDYTRYLKADQQWRKETSFEVERELNRQGFKYAKHLYDDKGNLKSKKQFYNELIKSGDVSVDDLRKFKDKIKDANERRIFNNAMDQMAKVSPGVSGYGTALLAKVVRNLDKIGPGNWLMSAIEGSLDGDDLDYDKLVKAAGGVYTSGRIKKPLPGLSQLGEMSGSGLFTPKLNSTWVNPKDKSNSTKGNMWGIEAINDINKIDWGATDKNRVTFSGITKTAWDKGGRNDAGLAILNAIKKEMMTNKTKMGNFIVSASPIALNSNSKAAIIIKPDAEWLKGYVYTTKDGKATSGGIISQDQYNAIMQNGISYITDSNNLSSDLYTRSYQSPLQSYVDYYGSYKYHDPANPDYSFEIKRSKTTNDYMTKAQVPLYNPYTGETVLTDISENGYTLGSNLESLRFGTITEKFDQYKQFNIQLKNGEY